MAEKTSAPHGEVHFSDVKADDSIGRSGKSIDESGLHQQHSEKAVLLQSSRELSVGVNPGLGYRHLVTFLCFLGCAMNYALRVNLSVAIVAMVKHEDFDDVGKSNVTEEGTCPSTPNDISKTDAQQGEFDWDANLQGLILSAFFYGAITTQLIGGVLAERFGGKLIFGVGIFLTSFLTLLTPPMSRQSGVLLIVARVIEGIGEGMTVPAMYVLLSKWSPRLERTQFGAFAMAGNNIGNVLGLALTGILCDPDVAGWPLAFYMFGALGLIWVLSWVLFVYEAPSVHPYISTPELNYILVTTGNREESLPTPWRAILTSPALWAITAAHFGKNWVYFTLLTTLPSYLRQVLRFDISQNGLLSSIPYLTMWAVEISASQLLDLLRRHKLLSTTFARKVFNSIGVVFTCIFLIVEGYVECDKTLAVVILSLSTGFLGLTSCGFQVNHLDIAPLFAGTLMGITNNIATVPGIVAPSLVEAITEGKPLGSRWRIVFYISAMIHMLGGFVFALIGSGKEQIWARHPSQPRLYTTP